MLTVALSITLALHIPTFSYFAFTMFFSDRAVALRGLWPPMLEPSPDVLRLGYIAYLTFAALGSHRPSEMTLILAGSSSSL